MKQSIKSFFTRAIVTAIIVASAYVFAPLQSFAAESFDNTMGTAVTLPLNKAAKGALSTADAKNWYKFTVTEAGYFKVRFALTDQTDVTKLGWGWNMSLYKEGNAEHFEKIKELKKATDTIAYPLPAGNYYVCIDAYNTTISPVGNEYSIEAAFTADKMWEKETNENFATANQLEVNKKYSANLYLPNDYDYYKFTIPSAGYFDVLFELDMLDINENVGWGWDIFIYNENYEEIDRYKEVKGKLTTSKYAFEPGTIYVKVEAYNTTIAPKGKIYNITPEFTATNDWESENNDLSGKADVLSLNKVKKGTLYHGGDADWFKVNVTKAGFSSVTLTPDPNEDNGNAGWGWDLTVFDKDQNEIVKYKEIKTKTTTQLMGLGKGTYYIKLVAYNSTICPKNRIYNLTYNFTENSYWESEQNNTKAAADKLAFNSTYKGVLTKSDDVDYYKFTVPKKCKVKFKFSKDATTEADQLKWGFDVIVYDKNNKEVIKTTGLKTSTTVEKSLAKGTYTVKVCPNNTTNAPVQAIYNISVNYPPAPKAATISKATPGKKQVALKWKKSSDATGYYIYRSTEKNGKYTKIATIKGNGTLKYTDKKGLVSKKTYYYKVVAYKTANKLTATTESKVKSAKVK